MGLKTPQTPGRFSGWCGGAVTHSRHMTQPQIGRRPLDLEIEVAQDSSAKYVCTIYADGTPLIVRPDPKWGRVGYDTMEEAHKHAMEDFQAAF